MVSKGLRKLLPSIRKVGPGRLIAFGFLTAILLGAGLLMLCTRPGITITFVDALFTSTSAVCVTGLVVVDTLETFTPLGCALVGLLIQIGGLGVSSVGIGFILLMRRRIGVRERILVQEGLNLDSLRGAVRLVRAVLLMTLTFELVGVALSYISFSRHFPPLKALGVSVFHSIASFNNAGFDVLGGMKNLLDYKGDVLLNLTTAGLIIFGGLGFLVMLDILRKRPRKYTLHTKIVLLMTAVLLAVGMVCLKISEDITWLGAFFTSVSARTAGFQTFSLGGFTSAGLFMVIMLMFIGASPGSTGGGIKTTTFFSLVIATHALSARKHATAFKRTIPRQTLYKSFVVTTLAMGVCCTMLLLLCLFEPDFNVEKLLFEVVSAFGTVGLSTGITPSLEDSSKLALTLTMYIGRLGPLAIASLLTFHELPAIHYSEEPIPIG